MAPLILNGAKQSTCTQRALLAILESNAPYEIKTIDFVAKEHKSPEYLKKQPFGKIPVLEDDGVLIYESRAIAKYVARKFAGKGNKVIPEEGDLVGYGLFEQACSLETSYFDGPASKIAYEKIFKKYRGLGDADEAMVKKHTEDLEAVIAVYDGILRKTAFLAGDEVTLADLFHLPYGSIAKKMGAAELFAKYPNFDRWFSGLENRDSWVKILAL